MAKYLKIAASGEITTVDLGDRFAGLDDLYVATRSNIVQMLRVDGLTMWLDEEGKFTGKLVNEIATKMFWKSFGAVDYIMGDVLLSKGEDSDGNLLGLTDDQIAEVTERITNSPLIAG